MTIRFCSPVVPDMDRVAFYLKESFEKKHLSNFGPAYQLLVSKLKDYLKLNSSKDILLTTSGHTALMAAYAALDLTNIVVPSYTFQSTGCAATLQGMFTYIVDVNERTGCLDSIPNYPWKGPSGIVGVCALSTIPDLDNLTKLAKTAKAKLVIDGAASFGTPDIYNYGDAFCLSFHATKTFPIGECGALISDKKTIERAKQYVNFGFDKDRNPQMIGMNAKVSEYTCAIGLALLEKMPDVIEKRRNNFELYRKEIGSMIPDSWKGCDTIYQALPTFCTFDFLKARKVREKLKEGGVETLQYYRPLSHHEKAGMLFLTNICLPIHQDLTSEEISYICKIVKSC